MRYARFVVGRVGADHFEQLAVLGYSCGSDGFAFNFAGSTAARKIIADFIASNVKVQLVYQPLLTTDTKGMVHSG